MNITEVWNNRNQYSAKLSETLRNISMGGLALLWCYRDATNWAWWAAGYMMLTALLADVLHYHLMARSWTAFARRKELDLHALHPRDLDRMKLAEFAVPREVNAPGYYAVTVKTTAAMLGVMGIVAYFVAANLGGSQ